MPTQGLIQGGGGGGGGVDGVASHPLIRIIITNVHSYGVQPPCHNMNDCSASELPVFHMQNVIALQPPPPL